MNFNFFDKYKKYNIYEVFNIKRTDPPHPFYSETEAVKCVEIDNLSHSVETVKREEVREVRDGESLCPQESPLDALTSETPQSPESEALTGHPIRYEHY